jgi:hypothetical protein
VNLKIVANNSNNNNNNNNNNNKPVYILNPKARGQLRSYSGYKAAIQTCGQNQELNIRRRR